MILNPKLLIVDDERGIVDMIQSYFQTQYDILTAYSGQEALKKVVCKPDLILLDINMPGMDGLTVCQQIREHISCPILFLTARIECDSENQCQNRGNGKGKLSPCHNVILGSRKGCIGFQKGIKGRFALICSYLNRKLLILN